MSMRMPEQLARAIIACKDPAEQLPLLAKALPIIRNSHPLNGEQCKVAAEAAGANIDRARINAQTCTCRATFLPVT